MRSSLPRAHPRALGPRALDRGVVEEAGLPRGHCNTSEKQLVISAGCTTFGGLGLEWTTMVYKYHNEEEWFTNSNLQRVTNCGKKGCAKPASLQMFGVHKSHLLPRDCSFPILCQFIAQRVSSTHKSRGDEFLRQVKADGFSELDWTLAGSCKLQYEGDKAQHASWCVHDIGDIKVLQ